MLDLNSIKTLRNPFFSRFPLAEPLNGTNFTKALDSWWRACSLCWYFTPVLEQIPSVLWEILHGRNNNITDLQELQISGE